MLAQPGTTTAQPIEQNASGVGSSVGCFLREVVAMRHTVQLLK
jgi:hypothetical protein